MLIAFREKGRQKGLKKGFFRVITNNSIAWLKCFNLSELNINMNTEEEESDEAFICRSVFGGDEHSFHDMNI
jgi:hypothetical protein